MKRGDKKGQIYLAAAIIIIVVFFGILAVNTYAKRGKKDTTVYDLKKELNLETGEVIDFALYSKENTSQFIQNWTEIYAGSRGDIEDWVFVYGDSKNLFISTIAESETGDITLEFGSGAHKMIITNRQVKIDKCNTCGNSVNITISGNTYNFKLENNQEFMFLIKKEGYTIQS